MSCKDAGATHHLGCDCHEEQWQKRVEHLEKALSFYADPFTWARVCADYEHGRTWSESAASYLNNMFGEKARATLDGEKGKGV